jgi:hypothetical protein
MRPAQTLILATLTVLPLMLPGCDPMADDEIDPREEQGEWAPAPEPSADSSGYELVGATAQPRPCGHFTAPQGQWGAPCSDHDVGCLRDDHFMGVFPEGLIVGCGVLTVNLVSSAAIEQALPSYGTARALYATEAGAYDGKGDPKVGTSLFGHTVALALNVGLDDITAEDDDDVPLEALIIGDPWSPCEGMSVGEVLEQANLALGDCPTSLSAATLGGCAQAINNAYANGQTCSSLFQLPTPPPQ